MSTDFNDALANLPVERTVGVQVVIRGRIGTTVDTGDVTIPAVPLELPIVAIPLPSVAALFRNPDLSGDAVLVMVPENSALDSLEKVTGILGPLRDLLATVDTVATVTAWATGTRGLVPAVDSLAARIPLTMHVGFRDDDSHYDLGRYNFIVVDNWFDTDIEDRGSSCLLVSASRRISFFQHDDYGGAELRLNALPQFPDRFGGCLVRNLHVNNPGSEPPGCVITTGTPSGGTWGDVISSYRWSPVREG